MGKKAVEKAQSESIAKIKAAQAEVDKAKKIQKETKAWFNVLSKNCSNIFSQTAVHIFSYYQIWKI